MRKIVWIAVLAGMGCGEGVFEDSRMDEVLIPEQVEVVEQALDQTQRVYVNFDGPVIEDCSNYCSDARINKSFAISAHFGVSRIDFTPWGSAAQRQYVVNSLRSTFSPYDVEIVEHRPSAGPYTMLVVSASGGPNHGVAPLDCDNTNATDIAFVYKVGSTSESWVAKAAAHELGHSFGLSHVTNGGDYMHWDASGTAFTHATWDSARSGAKCFSGNSQDAPTMLKNALGARGRAQAPACTGVTRLAGATRHETAVAVSKKLFPGGASAVVIVRDSNENPDALAAAPLAAKKGGPILLTATGNLPASTAQEVNRLNPSTIYVIGGAGAVSDHVVSQLRQGGRNVVRLAGPDRYQTAAKVARNVGASDLAIIASGEGSHLVDALAASGVAAAKGAPILLVTQNSIPAATSAALADLGVTRTVVAGGPASVSNAVMQQLPNPTRVSGQTRYDTAAALAQWGKANGVPAGNVLVARGDLGPDALAGGAAGQLLVLTPSDSLHTAARNFVSQSANSVTILGGAGAVSSSVEWALCDAL